MTEAGYVGEDVGNILTKLIQAADYDVELCSSMVSFISTEIDKITKVRRISMAKRTYPVKVYSRRYLKLSKVRLQKCTTTGAAESIRIGG